MSDRPTPMTDAVAFDVYAAHADSWVRKEYCEDGDYAPAYFARALERQLAEAKEAMQAADTLLAKLGYQPTDLTRAKLAQHLTP